MYISCSLNVNRKTASQFLLPQSCGTCICAVVQILKVFVYFLLSLMSLTFFCNPWIFSEYTIKHSYLHFVNFLGIVCCAINMFDYHSCTILKVFTQCLELLIAFCVIFLLTIRSQTNIYVCVSICSRHFYLGVYI